MVRPLRMKHLVKKILAMKWLVERPLCFWHERFFIGLVRATYGGITSIFVERREILRNSRTLWQLADFLIRELIARRVKEIDRNTRDH